MSKQNKSDSLRETHENLYILNSQRAKELFSFKEWLIQHSWKDQIDFKLELDADGIILKINKETIDFQPSLIHAAVSELGLEFNIYLSEPKQFND